MENTKEDKNNKIPALNNIKKLIEFVTNLSKCYFKNDKQGNRF